MMASVRTFVAFLLLSPALWAQTTRPTDAQAGIPQPELLRMYRQELGDLYDAAKEKQFLAAHELIEAYFAATTSVQRQEVVAKLEATGLAAEVLGRLARLRLHWSELAGESILHMDDRVGPHRVRYSLGLPAGYDRRKPWPLVVRLTSARPFLTDPKPAEDQLASMYEGWIKQELAGHPDAIVLMPWLDMTERFGPSYAGMNSVMQPLHDAGNRVNIDPAQVFLIGHASGASAAWHLALHYPTYFASFAAMAGGARADWQRARLMNLRNVLPVVWHDESDPLVKVDSSRQLVKLLRDMKLDVAFEQTKDVGHVPSQEIEQKLYEMMRSRTRALYPQQISLQSNRPDTMFNRIDWVQVYQAIRPGTERRALFPGGKASMVIHQFPVRIDAARTAPNRIEARAVNVQSLRFYFNERTADFAKPVTIVINNKTLFEDRLVSSIDEMLKDQLFLGRGWRYYTAIVDVDLVPPAPRPATTQSADE